MDRQPTLEGATLRLRPLACDDWASLYAVASDRELWAQHPMHDRWQEDVFRTFFDDALAKGGALAIVERGSGAVIGSSRYQAYDATDGGVVEIGWTLIARDCWGSGMNAEIKRLMLTHAFRFVDRVVFRVGETNHRSRKALEKIGARLTDRIEIAVQQGRQIPHVVYEITAQEFAIGPLA